MHSLNRLQMQILNKMFNIEEGKIEEAHLPRRSGKTTMAAIASGLGWKVITTSSRHSKMIGDHPNGNMNNVINAKGLTSGMIRGMISQSDKIFVDEFYYIDNLEYLKSEVKDAGATMIMVSTTPHTDMYAYDHLEDEIVLLSDLGLKDTLFRKSK